MADPFAGAAAGTTPAAWVGLGLALVLVAALNPRLAQPIRLTLYAVILYVFLANAAALAPALDRLNAALSVRARGAGGGRALVR